MAAKPYTFKPIAPLGSEFAASVVSWDALSDFDVMALAVVERHNSLALAVSAKSPQVRRPDHEAVYIIEDDLGATKIGIATCPSRRLRGLRCDCSRPLRVRALFWFYHEARGVERLSLEMAKRDGRAIHGEWVSRDWFECALIVASAARSLGAIMAPSEAWLQNRHARLELERVDRSVEPTRWDEAPALFASDLYKIIQMAA